MARLEQNQTGSEAERRDREAYKQALADELEFRESINDPSLIRSRKLIDEALLVYPIMKEIAGELNADAYFRGELLEPGDE